MNLSWFNLQTSELATDLIEEQTSLTIDYANEITEVYKDIWLQNNGDDSATPYLLDFGFYISYDSITDIDPIFKLASASDIDDKPYGAFLVFGYTDGTGEESYIDLFKANLLTREQMLKFQLNWNQGSTIFNKLDFNSSYTYNGSSYVERNTFPTTFPNNSNTVGENRGKVKISLILRYPSSGPTYTSEIQLNAYALNSSGPNSSVEVG